MPTNTDSDAAWKEALNAPEMGRLIDRIRRREFTDGPRPGAKAAKDYTVEEVENILIRNYRLQFGTVANLKAKSPKGKGENVFGDVNRALHAIPHSTLRRLLCAPQGERAEPQRYEVRFTHIPILRTIIPPVFAKVSEGAPNGAHHAAQNPTMLEMTLVIDRTPGNRHVPVVKLAGGNAAWRGVTLRPATTTSQEQLRLAATFFVDPGQLLDVQFGRLVDQFRAPEEGQVGEGIAEVVMDDDRLDEPEA